MKNKPDNPETPEKKAAETPPPDDKGKLAPDKAAAARALRATGYTQEQIAKALGVSQPAVSATLKGQPAGKMAVGSVMTEPRGESQHIVPDDESGRAENWKPHPMIRVEDLPPVREDFPPLVPPFNVLPKGVSLSQMEAANPVYLPNTHFRLDGQVDMDGNNETYMSSLLLSWTRSVVSSDVKQMIPDAEFLDLPLYPREAFVHQQAVAKVLLPHRNFALWDGEDGLMLVPLTGAKVGGRRTMAKLGEWERAGNAPGLRIMFFPYWEATREIANDSFPQDALVILTGPDNPKDTFHTRKGTRTPMLGADLHAYLRCAARDQNPVVFGEWRYTANWHRGRLEMQARKNQGEAEALDEFRRQFPAGAGGLR